VAILNKARLTCKLVYCGHTRAFFCLFKTLSFSLPSTTKVNAEMHKIKEITNTFDNISPV
jgi:hypothetical protein